MTATERFITAGKGRIWACSTGRGVPAILCNGGPGCCDYLAPVAAMIDDVAESVRWEMRGCGRSSADESTTLQECIDDLDVVRAAYGHDQVVLIGHSWGPELALAYALAYPQRVLGLIAINGGGIVYDADWSARYRALRHHDETLDFLYAPNRTVNRSLNRSTREFFRAPAIWARIARLPFPTVMLYGSDDIRPAWPAQQVACLLPHGRFIAIPGAGHHPWLRQPARLADELHHFFADLN
ncbi:hypothetical protein LBMAG53_02980 [Planctomycetota bacterium]|nr:hypothetical protein LBMAG53_02980 [Planctomycetota bacterium]